MAQKEILCKTAEYVRQRLFGESSGHDWWHIWRVWQLAKRIGMKEKADLFTVELAVLLHDIADWKFYEGDETMGPKEARKWLEKIGVDNRIIVLVCQIIKSLTFKGVRETGRMQTKEGMVVQDADRLDAIGAIGIARGFMFAGRKNLPMYDPDIKPLDNITAAQYKNLSRDTYTQINHFYEKLLLLKDLMNTKTGKAIARNRHNFMEQFLARFYQEWKGKD